MSQGLEFPWLHETNLIIPDKDRQGQTWRKNGSNNINHAAGTITGRFSSKSENLSPKPRTGNANSIPGTETWPTT